MPVTSANRRDVIDENDPDLIPFRSMRTANWTVGSGWFIAEGPLLVDRLLHSDYGVHSALVDTVHVDEWSERIPSHAPMLVATPQLISQLVGFKFHRGVLACGLRRPIAVLRDVITQPLACDATLVAVQGVQDPENLGGILRSCAALGVDRVIIGPNSADPFSRRVLRVSMGTVLKLQLARSHDLIDDLTWLAEHHGVQSIATTLSHDAEPLERATRTSPLVILLGNEAQGLPDALQRACDRRVRINMRLGIDSLNVSVAAGIVLHHFCRYRPPAIR